MLSKEEYDEIYSKVPRTCVEILIKTDNGFILSRRLIEPCAGMWHIPGGTVYFGERLIDAARRVGIEELGIKVDVLGIIEIVNYLEIFEGKQQAIGIVFFCKLSDTDKLDGFKGSYQAEEIKAFRAEDIPENTIPAHKRILENKLYKEAKEYVTIEDISIK